MGLIYSESGADEFPHLSKTINSNKFSHEKESRWLATAPLFEEAEGKRGWGGFTVLWSWVESRESHLWESRSALWVPHTENLCTAWGAPSLLLSNEFEAGEGNEQQDGGMTPATVSALRNNLLFTENRESIWLQRERWNQGSDADSTPLPTLLWQKNTETLTED